VLSACQTGVGEVKRGDGVMGLRRAFVMAGTSGLVMSLWRVPDKATSDLMCDFYRRYFQVGDAALAMTQAQRAVIASGRKRGKPVPPYYWGAFAVTGGAN